jgi:hypothetical protein
MRPPLPQHLAYRQAGLPSELEIRRHSVEKILDVLGRAQAPEHRELSLAESQVVSAGEAGSHDFLSG